VTYETSLVDWGSAQNRGPVDGPNGRLAATTKRFTGQYHEAGCPAAKSWVTIRSGCKIKTPLVEKLHRGKPGSWSGVGTG